MKANYENYCMSEMSDFVMGICELHMNLMAEELDRLNHSIRSRCLDHINMVCRESQLYKFFLDVISMISLK